MQFLLRITNYLKGSQVLDEKQGLIILALNP